MQCFLPGGKGLSRLVLPALFSFLLFLLCGAAAAQDAVPAPAPGTVAEQPEEESILSPGRVGVNPLARDDEIRERLQGILDATGWFSGTRVRVREGVAFLEGTAETAEFRKWAGNLAHSTEDVAAVVNRIGVAPLPLLDFSPAVAGLHELWRGAVRDIPLFGLCLLILAIALAVARLSVSAAQSSLRRRVASPLLRSIAAHALGFSVFIVGFYIVLEIAGLTSVALTVVGGTGLLGIIFGIAFRDITENFLASIFLSMQSPFASGDLVEIAGVTGYVQRLTTRATVLLTLDGNRVQVPNATVYKSNVTNFTVNPNRREDFTVGIGYDDGIAQAQAVALAALENHPAVLKDPEPWVLAESLGASTVNLRVYFWMDGRAHSWLKVRSSVIRLVKRAFQEAGITMPDEAREMIFPKGVPVHLVGGAQGREMPAPPPARAQAEPAVIATAAEAGLHSEAGDVRNQEQAANPRNEGEDLLENSQGNT